MVFKICEGMSCSSFNVEEFDIIVHKKVFSLYSPIKFLAILYPKSLANLVVNVWARHFRQIPLNTTLVNNDQKSDISVLYHATFMIA